VSVSKSTKSSSKSHSNHNPVAPEASAAPAPAPVSASAASVSGAVGSVTPSVAGAAPAAPASGSASPPTPISTLASQAIAQLAAIESMLNLDIVVAPNDKNQAKALLRITDAAIGLASDIVSAAPARFPDFADLPSSASYVEAIGLVAARAAELATHIQKSVQNQRTPAATKTLALYAVVKGLGRITENETMREKVSALKAEVVPKRKNPKPKETVGEKAAKNVAKSTSKKVAKAIQVLNAAGMAVTTTTPVAAAPAPSPSPPATVAPSAPSPSASSPSPAPAANGVSSPVVTASH